jgi:NADH dehydrogenase (ubiquinone) 1 alpha/beta subcomplex 1
MGLRGSAEQLLFARRGNVFKQLRWQMCTSAGNSPDRIMDRVIELVKKFDKIDANKVTN